VRRQVKHTRRVLDAQARRRRRWQEEVSQTREVRKAAARKGDYAQVELLGMRLEELQRNPRFDQSSESSSVVATPSPGAAVTSSSHHSLLEEDMGRSQAEAGKTQEVRHHRPQPLPSYLSYGVASDSPRPSESPRQGSASPRTSSVSTFANSHIGTPRRPGPSTPCPDPETLRRANEGLEQQLAEIRSHLAEKLPSPLQSPSVPPNSTDGKIAAAAEKNSTQLRAENESLKKRLQSGDAERVVEMRALLQDLDSELQRLGRESAAKQNLQLAQQRQLKKAHDRGPEVLAAEREQLLSQCKTEIHLLHQRLDKEGYQGRKLEQELKGQQEVLPRMKVSAEAAPRPKVELKQPPGEALQALDQELADLVKREALLKRELQLYPGRRERKAEDLRRYITRDEEIVESLQRELGELESELRAREEAISRLPPKSLTNPTSRVGGPQPPRGSRQSAAPRRRFRPGQEARATEEPPAAGT